MKEKLLLVGAGGFGRVVLEHAIQSYDCAFADDGPEKGTLVNGIPVIGTTKASDYVNVSCDLCFIDYDENKVRLMRYGVGKSRVFDI